MYILWSKQVGDKSWVFKEAAEFKCADSRIWPVFNEELKKTNDFLDFELV